MNWKAFFTVFGSLTILFFGYLSCQGKVQNPIASFNSTVIDPTNPNDFRGGQGTDSGNPQIKDGALQMMGLLCDRVLSCDPSQGVKDKCVNALKISTEFPHALGIQIAGLTGAQLIQMETNRELQVHEENADSCQHRAINMPCPDSVAAAIRALAAHPPCENYYYASLPKN